MKVETILLLIFSKKKKKKKKEAMWHCYFLKYKVEANFEVYFIKLSLTFIFHSSCYWMNLLNLGFSLIIQENIIKNLRVIQSCEKFWKMAG